MKRRDFLKLASGIIASMYSTGKPAIGLLPSPQVVRVENGQPVHMLKAALQEFGGIKRFVAAGDMVLIKPDMAWDRMPELAASTNSDLVVEIIMQCFQAGAKEVGVLDRHCNHALQRAAPNGIELRSEAAGAQVILVEPLEFPITFLPYGKKLKYWPISQEYLAADKVINVPFAKKHGLDGVSLGIRNLQAIIGRDKGKLYADYPTHLIDIVSHILPTLSIIDATNTNHRSVNNPKRKSVSTLIVSPCAVSADVSSLALFGYSLKDIPYLQAAVDRGLSVFPLQDLHVKTICF